MSVTENHPVEDVFGTEITSGDVYYKFGEDAVNEINIKRYLVEFQEIECYKTS